MASSGKMLAQNILGDSKMIAKATLAAGFIAAAAFLTPASAAPLVPQSQAPVTASNEGLVQQVHYRHHRHWRHRHWHHRHWRHRHFYYYGGGGSCAYVRNTCAARFGWGTGAYHRCLWRRGC